MLKRNLTEDVAAQLGPMGVWNALHPHIPSLRQPSGGRVEVKALCPFHDDRRPSWCWNLAKGIATCHVCGEGNTTFAKFIAQRTHRSTVDVLDDYCKQFGWHRLRGRTLTVAEYAKAKALPVDFLTQRFGLYDGADGVQIPYVDASGELIAERYRKGLGSKPRWKKGVTASKMVYGIDDLSWIQCSGHVFVVEGESDLHTAAFYDMPALALPGSSIGHRAMVQVITDSGVQSVYAVADSDQGGRVMLTKLNREFKLVGWTKKLVAVQLPTKDLSDLHVTNAAFFEEALNGSLQRAKPIGDVLEQFKHIEMRGDATMVKIVEKVLSQPNLNSTDRVILIGAAVLVKDDPSRVVPITKSKLARSVGISRRSLYDRMPKMVELGLFKEDDFGLRIGTSIVR